MQLFEESGDLALLSDCDDQDLHIHTFKQLVSTKMTVDYQQIFETGKLFQTLRTLSLKSASSNL